MRLVAVSLLLLMTAGIARSHGAEPSPPANALENRISGILEQMTVQEKIEQLYYKTDGNERLGIPQFRGSDGPHGIGNGAEGWSCFPVPLAMTATWEPGLIKEVGKAINLEQASRGRHRIAGPVLDLLHDPRNGRAPETIGEDPFLGGRIMEAFLQGQNETAVFGTIKHYNLNTYEAERRTNDYLIDQRSLVEFWGAHWRRAVQDGGALSVMCAYNLVNGEKCAENHNLIKTILRDHWGFSGYTMCDWGGFWSTEKAMASELDFCEGNDLYIKELPRLVEEAKIDIPQVDNAVRNILRVKILAGMLDGQPAVSPGLRDCPAHRQLAYECGLRGLVLLKNENQILPLSKSIRSVAVIGPNAGVLPLDGHSSSAVIPSYTITPRQGIEKVLGAERVHHAQGCEINSENRREFAEAKQLARTCEVVIFVAGLDNTVEGEGYFIGGDRLTGTVDLPGVQNDLINQLAEVNPNVVVVVISGGTCAVNKAIHNVRGLLYAFYPGQEGGRAIADILFGDYNPSGKLPVTIPKSDAQLPATDRDFRNVVTEGVGYRWFDSQGIKPEFVFGHGLSYTTFEYHRLRISPTNANIGETISIAVDVTNVGDRRGEEVVQLYLATSDLKPSLPMPKKQLRGFRKVAMDAGETKTVEFQLTPEELYVFNSTSNRYLVPAGRYAVLVGGSSENFPLTADFVLAADTAKPDLLVTNIRTVPPYPKPGDEVIFLASVLNRGTGSTSSDDEIVVSFAVGGSKVARGPLPKHPIRAGGMALAVASSPSDGTNSWTATEGEWTITAEVDDLDRISELSEANNVSSASLRIPGEKARAFQKAN